MNIFLILFIILFLSYLILFILNYNLSKKYYEYYEKQSNGLLCGEKNDICSIDEEGDNNCCSGYSCIRPEGNFHNKICKSDEELNFNTSFKINAPKITYPVIKKPSINIPGIDSITSRIPNVDFPNINLNNDISNIKLPSNGISGFNFDSLNFNKLNDSLTCNTIK